MAKSGKGSSFEREICHQLSRWWTGGERDDIFWRCAGSGAMAKTRSNAGKKTFGQYGDIQAVDPIGQPLLDLFTIELKRGYSGTSFADMLDRKPGAAQQIFDKMLCQVLDDQKNSGSEYWMLIVRRDRRDTLLFIPFSARNFVESLPEMERVLMWTVLKDGRRIKFLGVRFFDFLLGVNPIIIQRISPTMKKMKGVFEQEVFMSQPQKGNNDPHQHL